MLLIVGALIIVAGITAAILKIEERKPDGVGALGILSAASALGAFVLGAIWIISLFVGLTAANTASPAGLKQRLISVENEHLLRDAEQQLRLDKPGFSELWHLDLADYRRECLEIRRANALAAYNNALEEHIVGRSDIEPWSSLDYRDIAANANGIWWNPLGSAHPIWPDVSRDAVGPLVRLADVLLRHDSDDLNALMDREMELPGETSSLLQRNTYRKVRESAHAAMRKLAQVDSVLDGGPDPDGLCPWGAA